MRIPRVFVPQNLESGCMVVLDEQSSRHLCQVLRLKPGAPLRLFNGRDLTEFEAELAVAGKRAQVAIIAAQQVETESPLETTIIQALSKSDHLDWTLQKCTELGVGHFRVFNAERSQPRLKPALVDKKMRHWKGVIQHAAEQSGRVVLPEIEFFVALESAINGLQQSLYLLDFDGLPIQDVLPADATEVSCLIGPEGGFSDDEICLAKSVGARSIRLGPRTLRTETAAAAILTLAQNLRGDLS